MRNTFKNFLLTYKYPLSMLFITLTIAVIGALLITRGNSMPKAKVLGNLSLLSAWTDVDLQIQFSDPGNYSIYIKDLVGKTILDNKTVQVKTANEIVTFSMELADKQMQVCITESQSVTKECSLSSQIISPSKNINLANLKDFKSYISDQQTVQYYYSIDSEDFTVSVEVNGKDWLSNKAFNNTTNYSLEIPVTELNPGFNFIDTKFSTNFNYLTKTYPHIIYYDNDNFIYGGDQISLVKYRIPKKDRWEPYSKRSGVGDDVLSGILNHIDSNGEVDCTYKVNPGVGFTSKEELEKFSVNIISFKTQSGQSVELYVIPASQTALDYCKDTFEIELASQVQDIQ